jgi:hypothetical protein
VAHGTDLDADLRALDAVLRKLEAEYNMYFAGRLPRPPWEVRAEVERGVKRLERQVSAAGNLADRFRLQTIQSRYAAFVDLWDRGLRAREEGRPGPFAQRRRAAPKEPEAPSERVVYVTTFAEPLDELDKLQDLYERLTDVRRELGEPQVPFHKFAGLVRDQVETLKRRGAPEVAFRVAVRDGKIAFTARGLKGGGER